MSFNTNYLVQYQVANSRLFVVFVSQDRSMRLEPLEFQQCLYSLGYDVKEKDNVSMAANVGRRGYPYYDGDDDNMYSCLFDSVFQ